MPLKGYKQSEEHKRKISELHKGSKLSEEHKRKISKSLIGRVSWSRGLTKETDERLKKMGEKISLNQKQEDYYNSGEFTKGFTPWNKGLTKENNEILKNASIKNSISRKGFPSPMKGKHHTEEAKEKMSQKRLGKTPWIKGRSHTRETRKKIGLMGKGRIPWNKGLTKENNKSLKVSSNKNRVITKKLWQDSKYMLKQKKTKRKLWKNPEFVAKQMKSRGVKPNKLETIFENFLNSIQPREWKFVGDGQLIIGGKCPDFANINGQKKLIEVFGDYWHRGQDPQNRIDTFKKFGYNTLVIWEHDIKNLSENRLKFQVAKFLNV